MNHYDVVQTATGYRPVASGLRTTKRENARPASRIDETDLRLLRIFRAVATAGGLTAAERDLNMERSTISRHIQALEHKIGGTLCVRGPSGFALTELGKTVARTAALASDALARINDELNESSTVIVGDLYLGIADNCISNPDCRISAAIANLRKIAPDVRVHLSVAAPAELLRQMAARALHICVSGDRIVCPPNLDIDPSCKLFNEDFKLYSSAEHSGTTLANLARDGLGLIVREMDPEADKLTSRFSRVAQTTAIGLEAVATLIGSGQYVGYLPTHYAQTLGVRYGLAEVADATALRYTANFYLWRERARPASSQARLFTELLEDAHRNYARSPGQTSLLE